jgi:hypothetical protein
MKTIDETTGRYLPILYKEELPYWHAAREHKLVLQRCTPCDRFWYPIGPACPFCLSDTYEWGTLSGRGVISSYVVYHKGWTPWLESRVPYAVVQVELEEGPRLTANLLDVPASEVRIGMPVEAAYEKISDEITLVQFRPSTNGKPRGKAPARA